jgi:hypothetical protein
MRVSFVKAPIGGIIGLEMITFVEPLGLECVAGALEIDGPGFSVLTPLPGTDLWDETEESLQTRDWELFDIAHAVLPTKLPLDEFYRQYAGLGSTPWTSGIASRES